MDGDGSIQVNHYKKKNLQYRFVIKLKYHLKNVHMLYIFKSFIGGRVCFITSKGVYNQTSFVL